MSQYQTFLEESKAEISRQSKDSEVMHLTQKWIDHAAQYKYSYHFEALGRPIIQYPPDIVAMQEIIWKVKPDLIIETGIAHGGSLIWNAAMLSLVEQCEAISNNENLDIYNPKRRVIGIDIDIREHNRKAIEAHPLSNRIDMFQGSSVDATIVNQVSEIAQEYEKVLVCLDSNHTAEHVLAELNNYASLVSVGSYCIVFDTIIERMPEDAYPDRPWSRGNNPMTAVQAFIKDNSNFNVDKSIENKLLVTVAPNGFLYRHQ